MITGRVRDDLPRVRLAVIGPTNPVAVEFVVDTGFDGEMALPQYLLQQISPPFVWDRPILLADYTERIVPHYLAEIDWHGERHRIEIMALDGRPLIGNALLRGSLVQIEMREGGDVEIEPL